MNVELLEYLRSVDSPTLANAIEDFGIRDRRDGYIGGRAQCVFPDLKPMVGRALTVQMTHIPGSVADRTHYWGMWEALEKLGGPSVLVVQDVSGLSDRVAFCGEVMATLATRLGAVGMVTNGGVRDLDEVHSLGFHYFAPFPVVSHANFEVVTVGNPVTVFGQRVALGDMLHGDKNGVVIVPDVPLDELKSKVDSVKLREKRLLELIKSKEFTLTHARSTSGY